MLLLAFGLIIISCKRDDEVDPKTLIHGAWKPSKDIQRTSINGGTPTVVTTNSTSCEQQGRLIFNSNGSGTRTEYETIADACTISESATFTYVYNPDAKKLTVTESGEVFDVVVQNLTSNEMVIVFTDSYSSNGQTHQVVNETYFTKVN